MLIEFGDISLPDGHLQFPFNMLFPNDGYTYEVVVPLYLKLDAGHHRRGLTGWRLGLVIGGSVLGGILLFALVAYCCRPKSSESTSDYSSMT